MTAAIALFAALYLTMVLCLRCIASIAMQRPLDETPLALLTCAAWATFYYLQ